MAVVSEATSSLAAVVDEIAAAHQQVPGIELLVVDCSSDATAGPRVEHLAAERGIPCRVAAVPAPSAHRGRPVRWDVVREGVAVAASGAPDWIVTIDADGHHDPRSIPALLAAASEGDNGVTIGSRWVAGGSAPSSSRSRRAISRLAARLIGAWTGAPRVHDITSSFRVIRPDVVGADDGAAVSRGVYASYAEFVAVARGLGFAIGEVPIEFRPRHSAVPPLTGRDLAEFAIDLVRIRRRVRAVRSRMRADQTDWSSRAPTVRHQDPARADDFGAVEELSMLSETEHFTRWIVEQFDDVLGDEVLEVGAGLGSVTRCIAHRHPRASITALEPAPNVIDGLRAAVADVPRIAPHATTSRDWLESHPERSYDSAVYVNVLEHVRDDLAELRTAHELLRPGGRLCVFVPALPRLYGSLDLRSGHYRRYTRERLARVVGEAGFEIDRLHHLDALGVVPYWLLYRVLGIGHLDRGTSGLYDRVLVPVGRFLERRPPPIGKNLVLVARRPDAPPDT